MIGLAMVTRMCLRALITWRDPTGAARAWVLPVAIIGWGLFAVLWQPGTVPDQPWASRRLVPVILPGLIVLAVWVAAWLIGRAHARGAGLTAVALATACFVVALGDAARGHHVRDRTVAARQPRDPDGPVRPGVPAHRRGRGRPRSSGCAGRYRRTRRCCCWTRSRPGPSPRSSGAPAACPPGVVAGTSPARCGHDHRRDRARGAASGAARDPRGGARPLRGDPPARSST